MGTYTETISLSDVVVGDGWIGVTIGPVTVNGETPGPDLERVRLVFRCGQATYVLDSDDDEIEITDANAWSASIAARDEFLPRAGTWSWELEFYRSGFDSPWTLFAGVLVCHADLD